MLAYDFPLLGLFWTLLEFAVLVLWIIIVVRVFFDNFERRDHGGVAKAMWTVAIVFIPIIGVLAYIITRPPDVGIAGR
jgi:hypothetical protein